jgi:lysozyme family protein
MADYSIARDLLLYREKGFANVEGDTGGLTYAGITFKTYPQWPGWVTVQERMKQGPIENGEILPQLNRPVSDFYRTEYWDRLSLGAVEDQSVADQLMCLAVHYSHAHAVRTIQKVLNVKYNFSLRNDGVMGPKTIAAINSVKGFELNNSLFKVTLQGYLRSEQLQFIKGWVNRALDCLVG